MYSVQWNTVHDKNNTGYIMELFLLFELFGKGFYALFLSCENSSF